MSSIANVFHTHKLQFVIGGLFILLCIALLIYFLFFKSSSPSNPSQNCNPPKILCGTDCCNQCSASDPSSCSYCNSKNLTECPNSDGLVSCCDINSKCFCNNQKIAGLCPDLNENMCCNTSKLIPFNKSKTGLNQCCSVDALNPDGSGKCVDSSGNFLCCPGGFVTDSNGNCSCNSNCGQGAAECGGVCYDANTICCDTTTDPKNPKPFCKQIGKDCSDGKIPNSNVCGTQCCQGACDGVYCSQCNVADANPCQINGSDPLKVDCCYGGQSCLCVGGQASDSGKTCFQGNNSQQCCNDSNIILSNFTLNKANYKSNSGQNECCPYNTFNPDKTPICSYLDPIDSTMVANCCEQCTKYGRCDENCNRSPDLVSCEGMCWDNKIFTCTGGSLECLDTKTEVCSNNKNASGADIPPTITNCCLIGACEVDANNLQTGNCMACDPKEFTQCPYTSSTGALSYNCCFTQESGCMCTGNTAQCSNSVCCPINNIIDFSKTVDDNTCKKGNNCCCPWVPVDGDSAGSTKLCCPNGVDTTTTPWSCNKCGQGYFPCAGKCWDLTQFKPPCSSTGTDPGPLCIAQNNTRCGTTCCPGTCNANPSLGCGVSGCTDPSKVCDAGSSSDPNVRKACCAPDEICACIGGSDSSGSCSNPTGNTCCNTINFIKAGSNPNLITDICCPVPVKNEDGSWTCPDSLGNPLCCPNGYNAFEKKCGITCGNFSTYPDNTNNYDPQVCLENQGCVLETVPKGSVLPTPQPGNPPYCTADQVNNQKCESGTCFSSACNWGSTTIYPNPNSWINSKTCESTPMYINECNNETSQSKQDCNKSIYMVNRPVYSECDVNCQTEIMPKDSVFSDYVRYSYVQGSSECKELDCLKKMQEFGFENYFFDNTTFECVALAKPSGTCNYPDKQCAPESCQLLNKLPNSKTMKESNCPPGSTNNCVIFENLQETNCIDKSSNCITDPFIISTSLQTS